MMATDIGSGVLLDASSVGAGTGNYNSFLRIQNTGEEQGFNTDVNAIENNKDGIWTHSILLSSLTVVTVGGTDYYEIRLDLNETNSKDGPNITMEELQLFYGAAATTSLAGLTKVFDLGAPQALVDHNSGSGTDDYFFLVPTDLFPDKSGYLTLYSDFTGADG